MPKFTANYMQPYAATWVKLFNTLGWNANERKVAVEIGSYEGASALWIAENLLRAPDSQLYCIDPWLGDGAEERYQLFLKNVAETPARRKITHFREPSFRALQRLLAEGLVADLVYIDGSHAAPDVLADLVLAFRLVRIGGLIICDDYTWDDERFGGDDLVGRPKLAIDAFTTIYTRKIKLVRGLPIIQIAFTKLSD